MRVVRCSAACVVSAVSVLVALAAPAGAMTGTTAWQNLAFTPQSGTFTAYFAAVPLAASIDGVIGLSASAASGYDSLAVLVHFNKLGTIDASNGGMYAAAASVPYISGKTYRFRLVVNVAAHTCSVYVTPPSASELLLGSNYAFWPAQVGATSLGNWAVMATVGQDIVGSFAIAGSTAPASLTASAGADTTIVSGQSATLKGSASGGTAPYAYSWSPAAGLSSATAAAPAASPTATTTYTLTVTDAAGKVATDSAVVTLSANPTALMAGAGADATISTGQSTILMGSASGGTAPYTYRWSPAAGLSSTTLAAPTASPAATTAYTLTVTDAAGATASDTMTVAMTVPVTSGPGWSPPIGIPVPPFGISETSAMYKGQTYAYSTGTAPYNDAGNGPYTHYIDNTSPSSTDTSNAYGTAAKPRKTIPNKLAAGSVVEIHGGPYTTMETIVLAQGTAAQPIFLRGIGMPRLPGKLTFFNGAGLECKYAIVEGLSVYKLWAIAPSSYICFRNNDVHGDAATGGVSMDTYNAAYSVHHIVIYNNVIHDNGNWLADYDQDVHGITVARYTNNVWILDNELYHNSGDGLQINAGSMALQPYTHHIYVGRNKSHENKQAGLWSKQAMDVIFSQNTCYNLKPIGTTPSAWGSGMGFQYAPERIWFLYNHVYNCCFGISTGSADGQGSGLYSYYIGNVIHDIHHDPDYNYNYRPSSGYSEAGIELGNSGNRYIINNTIYECDAGINSPASGLMVIDNNIVSNITELQGNHILLESAAGSATADLSYNLFYQNGSPVRIRWAGTAAKPLQTVQTTYGKGYNCLCADPLFVNAAGLDFRLQATSPAIGHATASPVYQTFYTLYGLNIAVDYAGTMRPQGGTWDIGAYEFATGQ